MTDILAAHSAYRKILEPFEEELNSLAPGIDYDKITMDTYDSSIEFKGVPDGYVLPMEVAKDFIFQCRFTCMWLCHRDGSETYYWQRDGEVFVSVKESKKSPPPDGLATGGN